MKLVKPTAITDSSLVSSNVPENDCAVWSSAAAYVAGNKVMVLATHKIYEALTSSTNKYPPDNIGGTTPAWMIVGSTNRWTMLDQSYQSQTTNMGSIVLVLAPGRINSLGLMNVEGSDILVDLSVDSVSVYSKSLSTAIRDVNNWSDYLFNPIERRSDFVLMDIPSFYMNGILTITISGGASDIVKCGLCIPGLSVEIGKSLWGAKIGIEDYSQKGVDIFGNFSPLERPYSGTLEVSVLVDNSRTGYVKKILASYRTTPVLWVAADELEATIDYGFYRSFSIVLPDPSGAQCSIEILGLT